MTQYMISMSIYGVSNVLSMVRHCGKSKGNKYEFLWFQGAYRPEVMGEGRADSPEVVGEVQVGVGAVARGQTASKGVSVSGAGHASSLWAADLNPAGDSGVSVDTC